jgi:hypothetical protein
MALLPNKRRRGQLAFALAEQLQHCRTLKLARGFSYLPSATHTPRTPPATPQRAQMHSGSKANVLRRKVTTHYAPSASNRLNTIALVLGKSSPAASSRRDRYLNAVRAKPGLLSPMRGAGITLTGIAGIVAKVTLGATRSGFCERLPRLLAIAI